MKTHRSIALSLTLALIALAALACGKGGNSTPTEAFTTFYNAIKKADVASAKTVMTKKNLALVETEAKTKGIARDDAIKVELERLAPRLPDTMPETRDEKIEGDKATLEFKQNERWEKVNLTKEDDGWKVGRG